MGNQADYDYVCDELDDDVEKFAYWLCTHNPKLLSQIATQIKEYNEETQ